MRVRVLVVVVMLAGGKERGGGGVSESRLKCLACELNGFISLCADRVEGERRRRA